MQIDNIKFNKHPLFLAPMEDVTDPAFRLLCKGFGADMVYSEFISADALIRDIQRTKEKLTIHEEERPVVIQLYGREPEPIAEAAKRAEEANPDIIDLNFGCPVKKVAGKGGGAGLLKDVPKLLEIVKAVVKAVNKPVTVKTRLGWDENSKIITTLAEQIQDCGAKALAIHGRTRSQMYTGEADWTLIGEVKANPRIKIPIIGNGDVTTPERAKECFEIYGVDAVMIGRGSIGQPWIFEDIKYYLETGKKIDKKPFEFYLNILKQQVENNVKWLDERRGITHSRRHIAASPLFKGIDNFKQTKIAMLKAETKEELFKIMDSIKENFDV
ncbi:MAG: tRNA dihydrouridine synthase DusB [Paludibacteraceae bacterium]|nr:tRNA dihydrouridine synthase DusB [Paludibacteraceae bacterium]MBO5987981.1 tRNA dihydrouridine synthase DusB [Paludibacteraceae bacterium]